MKTEDFAQKMNNMTPKEVKDVERAREALHIEQESGNILPPFIPGNQAAERNEWGHIVYTKAGLLSDAEVLKHCGKCAKDLGLSPFCVDWQNNQVGQGLLGPTSCSSC